MNFKRDQFPLKNDNPSVFDVMILDSSDLEKLPSPEQILNEIEKAVLSGTSEASELIRQTGLEKKIQEAKRNILFLKKEDVVTYINVTSYLNNPDYQGYSEAEKMGGLYDPASGKIGILIDSLEIDTRPDFTKAHILNAISHELLHSLAKNLSITWLNEAITERLTQGLVRDVISSSKEWNDTLVNLSEKEDDFIRLGAYGEERSGLYELSETILDESAVYTDLPRGNYKERARSESVVFKENFGMLYFTGDLSALEKNLPEIGYSSISELETLDPGVS